MEEYVVLVDEKDRKVGIEEKIKAHSNGGMLHRAFSIYIFDGRGRLMLQHRAGSKYHGGGLWTNTVCGHPRDGEANEEAAHRRLFEEMGFDCRVEEAFNTIYRTYVGNGLSENEFLHVFFGRYDRDPVPNPLEAQGFRWISLSELEKEIAERPELYSPWMRLILGKVIDARKKNSGQW